MIFRNEYILIRNLKKQFKVILCVLFSFLIVTILMLHYTPEDNNLHYQNSKENKKHKPTQQKTNELPSWQRELKLNALNLHSLRKKFLCIGISTVYRKENYLFTTLQSITNETSFLEKEQITILIYLADTNAIKKQKQQYLVLKNFQNEINSGLIQVIESPPTIYPPMDFALTKRNFNDSVDRVLWRSKQLIDFAFIFSYAESLSKYYMVCEDDIIVSPFYLQAIKDFIEFQNDEEWIALSFSEFLGIGLLFKNSSLNSIVSFLLMFYQDMPWDMLIQHFINIKMPDKWIPRRVPSIFQHTGKLSTLPNKAQELVDLSFEIAKRKFIHKNPPAQIFTSIIPDGNLKPDQAYRKEPGFFKGLSKKNDVFDIVFEQPLTLKRVVILTGYYENNNRFHKKDSITDGILEASYWFKGLTENNTAICQDFIWVAKFLAGEVDVLQEEVERRIGSDVFLAAQCLRIKIGGKQKNVTLIKEIAIFE